MKHPVLAATLGVVLAAAAALPALAADPARTTRALVLEPTREQRSRIIEVMVHVPADGRPAAEVSEAAMQMAMDAALSLAADQVRDVPAKDLTVEALDYREFPVSNGKLPVTLTAEVRYPAAATAATQVMVDQASGEVVSGELFSARQKEANAPLEVRVWTQKEDFVEGEEMVIRIRANQDFHGRLLYRDVEGHVMQILPNAYRADTVFKANTDYVVPGPGDKFRLRVGAPFGQETIILMASTRPLGEIATTTAGNGVLIADASLEQVTSKTRALKLEPVEVAAAQPAKAPANAGAEFIERSWTVTTRAK